MQPGGGLSLQLFEVSAKLVLAEFLLEAKTKVVGSLDDNLNNEDYNFLTITNCIATPWQQTNPLKPIRYTEGFVKIEDIYLAYPTDPAIQTKIKLMPSAKRAIFYVGQFAVQANLSMGVEMNLGGAVDGLIKRFLAVTDVSVFPMFPASATMPRVMAVAMLNRAKISHYHAV